MPSVSIDIQLTITVNNIVLLLGVTIVDVNKIVGKSLFGRVCEKRTPPAEQTNEGS
jgi:hypothetical protein